MNMFHTEHKSFFAVPLTIIIKYVKSDHNGVSPISLVVLPNPQTKGSFMVLTFIPYKDCCTFQLMEAFFTAVL